MTPTYVAFMVMSAWVLLASFYVVTTRNVVRAAYALLGALFGVAVLYVLCSADFLAAVQVLIYVGGVNILIIFGVMLTEHMGKGSYRLVSFNLRPALVTCLLIGAALVLGLWVYPWSPAQEAEAPTAARIGEMFLTKYLLPFEVASVLLLVVLIGAVAVARKEVRDE
jgi:NADH:ubiquinone oxidoreductase subunit 6 (subunit J)